MAEDKKRKTKALAEIDELERLGLLIRDYSKSHETGVVKLKVNAEAYKAYKARKTS